LYFALNIANHKQTKRATTTNAIDYPSLPLA